MASLKEILKYRKQQEGRTYRKAEGDQERAVAMAVEYTLVDVEKELVSIQLEILYKLESNIGYVKDAQSTHDEFTREHFHKINEGIMIVYRRLFGNEEVDKLMTGEGMLKGLDLNKVKDVIQEVKK